MSTNRIAVDVTISADIKKVWDNYTNPEHITQWNFASDEWHCPKAENDIKVGGKLRSRMEAKDGSWGFDFEAVYDEVINLQRFTYTMTDGRKATTVFDALGDKTKVMITFDAESENPVEMQREGWQAILENFKNYAEKN